MNSYFTIVAIILLAGIPARGSAQIGINTNEPDSSAVLDIQSTTQGVLYPRMTNVQRNAITSPATGLMLFNTSTGCINLYNGLIWVEICGVLPADHQFIDGIYVSANGNDNSGDGSPQNPYGTLGKGRVELSIQNKDTLLIAGGEYSGFTLFQDTSIVIMGGFSDVYWTRDIENFPTHIVMGPALPAIITLSHNITLDGINISQDSTHVEDAVYGLLIDQSTQIFLESCQLIAGDGPDGVAGVPGVIGNTGSIGFSTFGSNGGGNGGVVGGGDGGDGEILFGPDPEPGNPGNGGAPGGVAGNGNGGGDGEDGAHGGNGMNGSGGSIFGTASIYYGTADGAAGATGETGFGGGGGGGDEGTIGPGGGGGGGGGSGGTGGEGGMGGGGSFGLYTYNSTLIITNCTLQSSDGGDGGSGGNGGPGATGGYGGFDNGDGGDGGDGGNGGDGGHGGGGGGGPSYGLYSAGASTISLTNVNLIHGQPGAGGASSGNPGSTGISGTSNL